MSQSLRSQQRWHACLFLSKFSPITAIYWLEYLTIVSRMSLVIKRFQVDKMFVRILASPFTPERWMIMQSFSDFFLTEFSAGVKMQQLYLSSAVLRYSILNFNHMNLTLLSLLLLSQSATEVTLSNTFCTTYGIFSASVSQSLTDYTDSSNSLFLSIFKASSTSFSLPCKKCLTNSYYRLKKKDYIRSPWRFNGLHGYCNRTACGESLQSIIIVLHHYINPLAFICV